MTRRIALIALFAAVAVAAALTGDATRSLWSRIILVPRAGPQDYTPSMRRPSASELVLIYVGKASCAYCRHPSIPGFVEEAKRRVRAQAHAESLGFSTVGVGLDLNPFSSLRHLRELGLFDELAVGRGWDNRAALQLFHLGFGLEAATPQLVVVRRLIVRDSTYEPVRLRVHEEMAFRVTGLDGIERWVRRGCPIPIGPGTVETDRHRRTARAEPSPPISGW